MPLPQWLRRLLCPLLIAFELVMAALLIVTAVVGIVAAIGDRRRRLLRLSTLGVAYISVELIGLGALFGVWLMRPWRSREWFERVSTRLMAWILDRVLGAGRRTVGFEVSVEEPPDGALEADEPVLVLARHGGPGDSYALVWLLLSHYKRRPRVVLKEALRWEPLLDVALTRMGACFLPRSAPQSEDMAERVGLLARDLRDGDALLLFPEGGNWTAERHRRAVARLWRREKFRAARNAELMQHVLPPRPAGVLACLDERPEIPVVVFSHTGLDRLTTAKEIWNAIPFSTPMTVRWWRPVPPPLSEDARMEWLTTEWAVVDQWIDATKSPD